MPNTTPVLPSTFEAGEGITQLTVGVEASVGYQKVPAQAVVRFNTPRGAADVQQAFYETVQVLQALTVPAAEAAALAANEATRRVQAAKTKGPVAPAAQAAPAPAAQAETVQPEVESGWSPPARGFNAQEQAQAPAARAVSDDVWAKGVKPNGNGTFDYPKTAVLSTMDYVDAVKAAVAAFGVPDEQVFVFDNRTGGNSPLETGGEGWSVGIVKAANDSALKTYVQDLTDGKDNVAYIDFRKPNLIPEVKLAKGLRPQDF